MPAADALLPASLPYDSVLSFLQLYRTHCLKVRALIVKDANLVPDTFQRFWQGCSAYLPILRHEGFCNVVAVCDDSLYRDILTSHFNSLLTPLSPNSQSNLKILARRLPAWVAAGTAHGVPSVLCDARGAVARDFAQQLLRMLTINHFAQTLDGIVGVDAEKSFQDFTKGFMDSCAAAVAGIVSLRVIE